MFSSVMDIFVHRTPNLKRLILDSNPSTAFPWTQLAHLTLVPDNMAIEKMGVLRKCTNLTSLDIRDFVMQNRNENSGLFVDLESISESPIVCSKMEVLTIRWHLPTDAPADSSKHSIFRFLSCPSLKILHLRNYYSNWCSTQSSWAHFDTFMAFSKRSSFRLTSLSIDSVPMSDSNLLHLLSRIPTLLDLTLMWNTVL
ncbi:hypothetical protein BT96DRAFT_483018 [Gymnopus androsaceus JB14]|uniref:F-box domain-containing protein n=1 Tax=Gymnopus androsaceus JB14 TaxID=1447944 RepID=A0A6A4GQN6_9AGAR|nr:hypothetical protein BT96DRAFT_483018 [Gymnopus androsaceus JB14]